METTTSFAPLAARLAAHAAELRPVEGSRDTLAKLMALVVCALLDLLVFVCQELDVRAAVNVVPVIASVSAPRVAPEASVGDARAPSLRAHLGQSSTVSHPRLRLVVDNRAKPGHDGSGTYFPCKVVLARSGLSLLAHGGRFEKSGFWLGIKHVDFVTIS